MPRESFQAKAARVKKVISGLRKAYPDAHCELNHSNPLELLVATILSAQCTDKRVNLVTPELFALADTPQKMAKVPVPDIQRIIRPCGLSPQKAKAISGLSRIIVEKHGGRVPKTFQELEDLPGVGHKTASVVMSQAFGVPAFPVDTHIHRLAKRWGLSSGRNVVQTEHDLKALFPESTWNKLHLRMIYFGREHCTARGCDGHTCAICSCFSPKRGSC